MAAPWRVFVLLVLTFSFLSVRHAGAQAPANGVLVNSDLEILSIGDLDGGGRVTWTYTGDNATLLRMKILQMFDEYANIPKGFVFETTPTGAVECPCPPGTIDTIDPPEAVAYLDLLELYLEGQMRPVTGTEFRYVIVDRTDRAEPDFPADRSTEGIVGTGPSSSQNIEIRFIFNARSASTERLFRQTDTAFADAPHAMFSFLAASSLGELGCPPWCYPFPAVDGWNVINATPQFASGGRFLWHGNRSATPWDETAIGTYERTASNATTYTTAFVPTLLDLRFATTATFSFSYTGGTGVERDGDVLLVQVSRDQATWENLTATNDGSVPPNPAIDPLPITQLGNSTFDLAPWIGQRIFLRLNFTADGDATVAGPGFYLRNLRIDAPSYFNSTIEFHHVDYVVGFLSFSGFSSPGAKPSLVRTPVGEIMWYSATYPRNAPTPDRARYAVFDFLENPQILFILLVIVALLLGFLQDKAWERYRMKHPPDIRATALKVKWLHWARRIILLLLVLFYFFPSLLGADLMVGGAAFWVLSIGSLAGVTGFSWFWYERQGKMIPKAPTTLGPAADTIVADEPPPPPPLPGLEGSSRAVCAHCNAEIVDALDTYTCDCGRSYHVDHAVERGTCIACGRPLKVAPTPLPISTPPTPETHALTVTCATCGEVNILKEGSDPAFAKCAACDEILQEVPRGYNYLLIADEPKVAYGWFKSVVKKQVPGLCMSTTFPEKLRREYGLPEVELYWLSDTSPGPRTLDPRRLDFEIMRALSNFVKNHKGAALVLDGLEYLIVENTFDRVLKFIKKVNDLASVHDATMFVPVTPTGLGPEEMTLLRKEFDKVETIPAARGPSRGGSS